MKKLTLTDIEQGLTVRKRELGLAGRNLLPRNDGLLRTESKRVLLQAIEDNAHAQGRMPKFTANFIRK